MEHNDEESASKSGGLRHAQDDDAVILLGPLRSPVCSLNTIATFEHLGRTKMQFLSGAYIVFYWLTDVELP